MATTNSISTTYAGEHAGKYISPALMSGTTLANGLVSIFPNIKYKQIVSKINIDEVVKDSKCDFDPTSAITQTERILEPKRLQTNLQLCKEDYHNTWQAIEQGASSNDHLPKSFEEYLIGLVAAKVAERMEILLYQGDSASSDQFDGFQKILGSEAGLPASQEVTGATITPTNVVAELNKIVDAIPSSLYGKDDTIIYASRNIIRSYIQALGGYQVVAQTNIAGTENVGGAMVNGIGNQGPMWYAIGNGLSVGGVNIVMANGMADNKAFATQRENLSFGTGLMEDFNNVKVLDMADRDASQNVRIAMHYSAGVQIGNIEDVVSYGIPNSSN